MSRFNLPAALSAALSAALPAALLATLPAAAPKRGLLDIRLPRSVMESPRSFKSVSSASSVTFAVTDDKSVKVEETVF